MIQIIKKYNYYLKNITLAAMVLIPFFLYYAALYGLTSIIYILLFVLALFMLLTMKIG